MLFGDHQIRVEEQILFTFNVSDRTEWSLGKIRIDPQLITEHNMEDAVIHEKLPTGQDKISPFKYGAEGVVFYADYDTLDNLGVSVGVEALVDARLMKDSFYETQYNDMKIDLMSAKALYFPEKNLSLLQREIKEDQIQYLFYNHKRLNVTRVTEEELSFQAIPDEMLQTEMIPSELIVSNTI